MVKNVKNLSTGANPRVQGGKKGGRFGGALTKSVEMGSWGLVSSPDLCLALVSSLPVTSEHHPPAARGYRLSMGKRLGDGPVERV